MMGFRGGILGAGQCLQPSGGKGRSSFLKKEPKNFCSASRGAENTRHPGAEVFLLLFLQKKKRLLSFH
jgi:hypothetical protein